MANSSWCIYAHNIGNWTDKTMNCKIYELISLVHELPCFRFKRNEVLQYLNALIMMIRCCGLRQQISCFEISVVYEVVNLIYIISSAVWYTKELMCKQCPSRRIRLASCIGLKKIAAWISWIYLRSFCQRQHYVIASSVSVYMYEELRIA